MKKLTMTFGSVLALALVTQTHTVTANTSLPQAPKTPKGLARCDNPITPANRPVRKGEQLEYDVEMLGLPLGKANIVTWRRGEFEGEAVTEYRAWVEPDSLVSALAALEAQAFSIVPDSSHTPVRSLTRYTFRGTEVKETQARSNDGRNLTSTLNRNGKQKTKRRVFPEPAHDYLTSFLLLRRMPANTSGCTVIYGEQRAYTVWISAEGKDRIDTAQGERNLDRYHLRYASDRGKKVREADVWMTAGPDPIPVQARGPGRTAPTVRLSGYRAGE